MLHLGNRREQRAQMIYATIKASLLLVLWNILESCGTDPEQNRDVLDFLDLLTLLA